MLIQQAIFTSAETSRGRGYHLVARSPGITNQMATELHRWCPSHQGLLTDDEHAESINFHPLDDQNFAVSRTVHGCLEYSQRGGLQVVTFVLIVSKDQLRLYDNLSWAFIQTARALGYLRFPGRVTVGSLKPVPMPDRVPSETTLAPPLSSDHPLDELLALVRRREQVALVCAAKPEQTLVALQGSLHSSERARMSFTTGLKPSGQRPFMLHLLPFADTKTRLKLSTMKVHCMAV